MYDVEKKKLSDACRILSYLGIAHDNRGHISYRVSDNQMLIPGHVHEEGRGLGDIREEDIVLIDFDGKVVSGALSEPMGEFYAYSEIYRLRKDINSVAHVHPLYANVLVGAGIPIKPVSKEGLRYQNGVSILNKFPLYIGDHDMGKSVARALGKSNIVMHAYHGAFITGKTIEDTTVTSIALEQGAYCQWLMSCVGKPGVFPPRMRTQPELIDSPHAFYHDSELEKTFKYYSLLSSKKGNSL